MVEKKADVLFHPVRIRITQALFGDRRLTAQQIAEALDGVSLATLYRHLNRLVEAGVVAVVEERPVRGAVEKVYAMAGAQAASFSEEDARQFGPEEQKRNFNVLMGTLIGDYERYIGEPTSDLREDGVLIRQKALNLTDDEARELSAALKAAFAPYVGNALTPSRRRRMLTLLLMPVVEPLTPTGDDPEE
jgi:DNA-binding transcriptional ArsR family regulator